MNFLVIVIRSFSTVSTQSSRSHFGCGKSLTDVLDCILERVVYSTYLLCQFQLRGGTVDMIMQRSRNSVNRAALTAFIVLVVFLGASCVGPPGPQGPQGPPGSPGGLMCWDLNGNGVADPAEDKNGDTVFDALDCRGSLGPREIVISAHEMDPEFQQTVFAPTKASRGLTPVMRFTDGADKLLYLSTRVGNDWDEESSFTVTLIWSSPVTTGKVQWNVSYSAKGLGESVVPVTGYVVGLAGPASLISGGLTTTTITIAPDRISRGDLLTLSIRRYPMGAGDTIEGDVDLYQVVISYVPVGGTQ